MLGLYEDCYTSLALLFLPLTNICSQNPVKRSTHGNYILKAINLLESENHHAYGPDVY